MSPKDPRLKVLSDMFLEGLGIKAGDRTELIGSGYRAAMTEAATRWAAENVDLLGPPLARDPTVPRVRPAAPQLRTQGSIKVPIGLNAIGLGLPGAPSLWDARLPPGLTRRTEPGPAPASNWPPETVDRRAQPPIYPFGVAPDAGGQSLSGQGR
jgi:hypothetical protein